MRIPPLERVWQLHNGAACSTSDCRPPGNPFPLLPPAPKSTRDRWGQGGDAQRQICHFRFWPAPGPNLHARPRALPVRSPPLHRQKRSGRGLRARGRPHPRDCSSGEEGPRDKAVRTRPQALSGRGSRTERAAGTRGQRRSRPGKELLLNGAPRPAAPRCGHAGGGTNVRANAPRLPHRRTAGEALRLAESPHLPGERTPRAHGGARPRTLTRAAHSRRLRPHPCAKQPRAPRTPQGPHPVHQTPASCSGAQGPACRGPGPLGPTRRPSRRPARPGFPSTARTPRARPRHEAGRKGRCRDWGWHRGSVTGAPPNPPTHHHHLFCSTKGCRRNRRPRATYRWPKAPPPPLCLGRGAGARAGEAQGCGAEIRAEAARRASRVPSPLPPRSAPATARRSPRLLLLPRPPSRPPPSGCGGAARQRWARLLRPAPTPRGRAGRREKGAKRPEVVGGGRGRCGLGRRGGVVTPPPSPNRHSCWGAPTRRPGWLRSGFLS